MPATILTGEQLFLMASPQHETTPWLSSEGPSTSTSMQLYRVLYACHIFLIDLRVIMQVNSDTMILWVCDFGSGFLFQVPNFQLLEL